MQDRTRKSTAAWIAVFSTLVAPAVSAAELTAATAEAFERYVKATEARMAGELDGRSAFLWVDRQPERQRRDLHERLKRGEVVVSRLETRPQGADVEIPGGLGHHWVGTVLIPGATLQRTIQMVQDYDRYASIYSPNVRRSRTISRDGARFRVFMQLFMKRVISVVLNTEYDVEYLSLGPARMHVRSYATRIAEVEAPGTAQEKEKPVGQGGGYLWRFNNYCSFEERDRATFMQCESVSLSRDVPLGLGWLVGPFVTSIPRESLTFTLNAAKQFLTRQADMGGTGRPGGEGERARGDRLALQLVEAGSDNPRIAGSQSMPTPSCQIRNDQTSVPSSISFVIGLPTP